MKKVNNPKGLLWTVFVLVLLVFFIRVLDSTLGSVFGKTGEIIILSIVIIVVLWLLGNRK